ncbi:hypothetical protein [Nonomuraea sp. SYSU D8015]|uniref:hypothetical protein n=1 Tax=Nonomuraea sp. SYSU D8015 TaxID=2593644 RepID=UPI001661262E|nr:hypothetical protein [Nonomuraea sp. SYSU D8015]
MSASGLRRILLAAGLVVLLALAWLLGRQQGQSAAPQQQPTLPPVLTSPSGAPTPGTPHQSSRQGALTAAATMVAQLGSPRILTEQGRKTVSTQIAEPGRQQALEALLAQEAATPVMAALRDDDERGLAYGLRTVPVSLRLDSYGQGRAQVAVFCAVYVASTSQPAALGHGTVTVELVWSGGWRLRSYRNAPSVGPAPVGYFAPAEGWRPISGESVIALSYELRQLLSQGSAPPYGLP